MPMDAQPSVNPVLGCATSAPGYNHPNYPYPTGGTPVSDCASYPGSSPFASSPDSPGGWGYAHPAAPAQVDRSNFQNPVLRGAPRNGMQAVTSAEPWHGPTGFRTDHDTGNFRSWSAVADPSYGLSAPSQGGVYGNQEVDSTARSHPPVDTSQGRYPQEPYSVTGHGYDNPVYSSPVHPNQSPQATYYQHSYSQSTSSSSSPASAHSLPRHTYTRTLVGPLSSNACRLLDEHRRPGIFFLFQDLSVRTEGKFRLRLRLMNVGDSATPGLGATRVHTAVSPVLAQAFTETFTVYSAKRFPGVPDTTPLSIAFGNQGQKLPLRNRHGTGSGQSRKMHQGESGDSDESDDTR